MNRCVICKSDAIISNTYFVIEEWQGISGYNKIKQQRIAGVVRSALCSNCINELSQQKSNKNYGKLIKKGEKQQANNLLLVSALKFLQDTSLPDTKKPSIWWETNQGEDYYIPRFIPEHCVLYNMEGVGRIYHKFPTGNPSFHYLRKNHKKGTFVEATEPDTPGFFFVPRVILLPQISDQLVELENNLNIE